MGGFGAHLKTINHGLFGRRNMGGGAAAFGWLFRGNALPVNWRDIINCHTPIHTPLSSNLAPVFFLFVLAAIGAFQPEFVESISNVSVAVGRDATFTCHVRRLGGYRVSQQLRVHSKKNQVSKKMN